MRFCRADASHALSLRKAAYLTCSKPVERRDRQVSLCRLDRQRHMHACVWRQHFGQATISHIRHPCGQATESHMLQNKIGRVLRLHCCASPDQAPKNSSKPKVVGLGSVGLDYLAQVARFPTPDEKLRTEKMEVYSHTP